MKKTKKVLILGLCAVLLVAASVLGTMAYLTDTTSVTNTFTVGNVAITLDELDVDNSTQNAERDTANRYHLLPGKTYTKDPTIHVQANSEDCFLFVKVENGISDIEDSTNSVASQMEKHGWTKVKENVYVYGPLAAPTKVMKSADVTNVNVFDEFTIAGTVNNTTLAANKDNSIVVTAYAIQADGFDGKTASQILDTSKLIQ